MVMFAKPTTIQRVMQYQGAHAHIRTHQKMNTQTYVASKETFIWFVIGWA